MLHAAVLGTYAAPLRMLVRSYAWIYLVVCAGAALPGQNAMCSESPFAAACYAGAESSGGVDRKTCRVLLYAAVCCACAVTSGGLAILMCRALIYAAGCCASLSAPASCGLIIMACQVSIHAAVLCLPCGDWQALYTDMPRADTRCSMLLLRCSAWQLGSVGILLGYMPPSAVAGMRFSHPFS